MELTNIVVYFLNDFGFLLFSLKLLPTTAIAGIVRRTVHVHMIKRSSNYLFFLLLRMSTETQPEGTVSVRSYPFYHRPGGLSNFPYNGMIAHYLQVTFVFTADHIFPYTVIRSVQQTINVKVSHAPASLHFNKLRILGGRWITPKRTRGSPPSKMSSRPGIGSGGTSR